MLAQNHIVSTLGELEALAQLDQVFQEVSFVSRHAAGRGVFEAFGLFDTRGKAPLARCLKALNTEDRLRVTHQE